MGAASGPRASKARAARSPSCCPSRLSKPSPRCSNRIAPGSCRIVIGPPPAPSDPPPHNLLFSPAVARPLSPADMDCNYVIAGRITREYILPPSGHPLLDAPGGNVLYAAGGLLPWDDEVGVVSRVGEDYPRPWLKEIRRRGLDI